MNHLVEASASDRTQSDYQRTYRARCRDRGQKVLDVVVRREARVVLERLSLETGLSMEHVVQALLAHPRAPEMLAHTYG
jgi:hypothetical protein